MMAGDALGIMHAVARDGGAVAVPPVLQSGSTGREPPLAACLPDGNGAELTPQAEEGGSATPLPPPPAPPHPPPPPLPLELLVDVDLPAVLVALSARRSMLHAPCQCWAVNAKERGATLLAAALPTLLSEVEAALQCAAPPLPPPPPLARGSGGRPVSPAARARVPTPEESAASSAVAASCAASVDAVAAAFEAALALAVVVVGGGDSGVDTGTVFGGPAGGEGGAAAAGKSAVLDRLEQWLDAEESARGTKEGRSVD